jgi:hypothetical protein
MGIRKKNPTYSYNSNSYKSLHAEKTAAAAFQLKTNLQKTKKKFSSSNSSTSSFISSNKRNRTLIRKKKQKLQKSTSGHYS